MCFLEIIELRVRLSGYTIAKDKRFLGSIKLPHVIRPNLGIGIIGDKIHYEQAQQLNVGNYEQTFLSSLNKEKKPIKLWAKKLHLFFASEGLIKSLQKRLCPVSTRLASFLLYFVVQTRLPMLLMKH
jgi:large subunit ribosomal protein L10Ae